MELFVKVTFVLLILSLLTRLMYLVLGGYRVPVNPRLYFLDTIGVGVLAVYAAYVLWF